MISPLRRVLVVAINGLAEADRGLEFAAGHADQEEAACAIGAALDDDQA
jgi:hypothetical protein